MKPPTTLILPAPCLPAGTLRPRPSGRGAFTLVETAVAAALITLFLSSMFLLNSFALRMLRSGNETAAASQILQARAEQIRMTSWLNITNSGYVAKSILAQPAPTAISLSDLSETISAGPYQLGAVTQATPVFVIKRAADGSIDTTGTSGSSLANAECVQYTITERWTGWGGRTRERTIVTLASVWGSGQQ